MMPPGRPVVVIERAVRTWTEAVAVALPPVPVAVRVKVVGVLTLTVVEPLKAVGLMETSLLILTPVAF